jgi:hypothetical protein
MHLCLSIYVMVVEMHIWSPDWKRVIIIIIIIVIIFIIIIFVNFSYAPAHRHLPRVCDSPMLAIVLSRVRYAPPMAGSLIRLKKLPSAVNMSVDEKEVMSPVTANAANAPGCCPRLDAPTGKYNTCVFCDGACKFAIISGLTAYVLSPIKII